MRWYIIYYFVRFILSFLGWKVFLTILYREVRLTAIIVDIIIKLVHRNYDCRGGLDLDIRQPLISAI